MTVSNLSNSTGALFNPGISINVAKSVLATKASRSLSPLLVFSTCVAVRPNINFLASFGEITFDVPSDSCIVPPLIVLTN